MENNSENKLRFFYQYGGQKVLKNDKYPEVSFLNGFFFFNNAPYIENYHIELRSIDSITDEECVDFFDLAQTIDAYDIEKNIKIKYSKNHLRLKIRNSDFSYYEIDFLRKKRFLVPFNNLTTDQILSYGWAKIKEHEQ